MSAVKSILKIAESKDISIDYVSFVAGYKHKYHLKRALNNPGGISCKRIIKIAKALNESPATIIQLLSNYI